MDRVRDAVHPSLEALSADAADATVLRASLFKRQMPEHDPRLPFTVRGQRKNGSVTYHCQNAAIALNKLLSFQNAGHDSITVTGSEGTLSEADLQRLALEEAGTAGGAPIDPGAPMTPELMA